MTTLRIKNHQIEKIDYTDVTIIKTPNREIFLVLKQMALKQNDTISALEFNTMKMSTYYSSLNLNKNFTNKFILCYEKYISLFVTKPFRAIGWFFALHTGWICVKYDWYIVKDISTPIYLNNSRVFWDKWATSIKKNIFYQALTLVSSYY